MALKEHAHYNKNGVYDEAMSGFFRNVDPRNEDKKISVGDGRGKIKGLKARAILIDMEEGVVRETLNGPLGELFDSKQFITDTSGSGNNWAHGHEVYGPQYKEEISERIRRTTEYCDSLQSFMLLHSLGGGTGSGLGTYIIRMLADEYPDVYRFSTCVFPSADDDVVTSPYNSMLSLWQLSEFSDCVLPIENQALMDICQIIQTAEQKSSLKGRGGPQGRGITTAPQVATKKLGVSGEKEKEKPFDMMNTIAAHLLLSLTSSMRYEGTLNVDLNEVTMNLVPYPRLHFLLASLSPLYSLYDLHMPPRLLDQMFTDAFSKDHQLIKADPKANTYLACALMLRGDVEMSDIRRNIERMKPQLDFIHWNQEGWKVGHCNAPPVGQTRSLLCLANNCCINDTFKELKNRFNKLYKRKAHLHHYTQFMEESMFEQSIDIIDSIMNDYSDLQGQPPPTTQSRFTPITH